MKLMSMVHLVAVLLYPQFVSDFEHEISVNGSPRCRDSVSSESE
jgi:hypothetical protein